MSLAACLLLYSIAVCLIGPPMLRRLTRAGHAPRCGVAAWLVAIASVLISWFAAALLTAAELLTGGGHHAGVLASCFEFVCDVVFGHAGRIPQILVLAAATGGVLAVSVATVRLVNTFVGLQVRTRDHAEAVRLVGHPASADDGVFVVDSSERVAYCVSGRPPIIVVTTGALAALDADQLSAVLAHERAHLTGRHHLVLGALRSIAGVFPRLALMTQGATEVSRMLEMCADDAAARRHGRQTLLAGLMSLAGAAPVGALGAAGVATLSRAERLALPATPPVRMRARAALIVVTAVIAGGPLATLSLMASGTLVC